MADLDSSPLYDRIPRNNFRQRAAALLIFFLLLSLLAYRLLHLRSHGVVWLLALLCESWFTFIWLVTMVAKWSPIDYKPYPDRLLDRVAELPRVDMFVTTADPALEPPIVTVDTVLSLLAVDYPASKLSCYVSDDGASPLTFYAMLRAAEFAKLWRPFCRKYGVDVRAPSAFFSRYAQPPEGSSADYASEWREMKMEYEELSRRIKKASGNPAAISELVGAYPDFSQIERGNHPSIVKVIWQNREISVDGIPNLVYVSREKQPKCPHNFKAGAMNVLTRVSGVMTNAPFILNVDCDMFANNPQIVLQAMCVFLDAAHGEEIGFVQFPQCFHRGHKDDPFGNYFIVFQEVIMRGTAGIQGPAYAGTGCFHRRKIFYGQHPQPHSTTENEDLQKKFGGSAALVESAVRVLSGSFENTTRADISSCIEAAMEVADCRYEFGTGWGDEVGLVYGCAAEDILTGIKIHSMGWKSAWLTPAPPGFLGFAPTGGPASMVQFKRWATGLCETLLHKKHGPLQGALKKKLKGRQCLAYFTYLLWAARSVPEMCYALLPAYCLLKGISFLPQVTDPAIIIPAAVFLSYQLHALSEFIACRQSVRAWWNTERMRRISSSTAWFFGFLAVICKLLGLSETVFEITRKDQSRAGDDPDPDIGKWTFDSSPVFVTGTALVLVNLGALLAVLTRLAGQGGRGWSEGLSEMFCCVWVLLSFLPFVKGLCRKGIYGIPWEVVMKAAVLALLFFNLSM